MALLLIKRIHLYRTVPDIHLLVRRLLEGDCVFHPVLVVAVREVLSCMGTTRFFAVCGRFRGLNGACEQITEFEGFDEIAVPDHAAVFGPDLVEFLIYFVHSAVR